MRKKKLLNSTPNLFEMWTRTKRHTLNQSRLPMDAWFCRIGCLWVLCRFASTPARCGLKLESSSFLPSRRFSRSVTRCKRCQFRTSRESKQRQRLVIQTVMSLMAVELTLFSCKAFLISNIVMGRSVTLNWRHSRARWRIESRVIPGRISPLSGGVISSRSIKNRLINKIDQNFK